MTRDVVTIAPDWQVYEAAAEMTDRHIRHLIILDDGVVTGVLSIRDLLLAGQRVELENGQWAVLRDPLTFTVHERRRLQRYLLKLRDDLVDPVRHAELLSLLVGSWSYDLPLRADAATLA